ncbi:MAG: mercury methylation corrinoid protein HgcA [Nitrospirota bacterium]
MIGTLTTPAGPVPRISGEWSRTDYWGEVKCRTSAYRNDYTIDPGLYAIGTPDNSSEVLASANYKLSFDMLRRAVKGSNAWILVLDTRGINVWCAAGKGTFGTEELIRRIAVTGLERVVGHKRVIVPQLGAPGISAHAVSKRSGFRVLYGPVDAKDIPAYLEAGCKASPEMRTVRFTFLDRLVLTPMEVIPAMKKFPWFALLILVLFGLRPSGILFSDALAGGLPFLLLGVLAVAAGAFFTPLLLPYIPFRSFAAKGWIAGVVTVFLSVNANLFDAFHQMDRILLAAAYLFFPLAGSYIALQFTGSTTFTGMSGVRKELKVALPLYIVFSIVSFVLLLVFKLDQWRIL